MYYFARFVASELVRSDKENRMRAIITTDGVYFVKAKGPPCSDAIVLHLDYSELFITQILPESPKGMPGGNNFYDHWHCSCVILPILILLEYISPIDIDMFVIL